MISHGDLPKDLCNFNDRQQHDRRKDVWILRRIEDPGIETAQHLAPKMQ